MTYTGNSITKKDTSTRETDWTLHDSKTARVNTTFTPLLRQLRRPHIWLSYDVQNRREMTFVVHECKYVSLQTVFIVMYFFY